MFLMKDRVKDERILFQQYKIGNEGFNLLMGLLLAAIIIKPVFFNIPLREYWTEFAITMAGAVYVMIRLVLTGTFAIEMTGKNKRSRKMLYYLISSIVGGAAAGLAMGIRNYFVYEFSIISIPLVVLPIMFFSSPLLFAMLVFLDKGAAKRADALAENDDNE